MTGADARPRAVLAALVAAGAVAVAPSSPGLSADGRYALATATFAAVLWVTEGLPLPVTALCVPAVLTALGVTPTFAAAAAGFADPVVFLLLAGFVLAAALRRHGVDRRLAFRLVARLGTSPARLVLAVMVATAALSMLISNSATAAMMVPVALGVARGVAGEPEPTPGPGPPRPSNLEIASLLGVAYAATIGGVATLIGTPPNAIVVSQLSARLGYEIGFAEWLAIGVPVAAVSLPIAWYLLAVRLYPPQVADTSDARREARAALDALGPLDPAGRRTVAVAGATAALWLVGGLGFLFEPVLPPRVYTTLFGGTGASLVGVGHQGLLYYVVVGVLAVPALVVAGAVDWDDVAGIDWGTLVLLGGGLSLADALSSTDAVGWLADVTFGSLVGVPVAVLVFAVVAVTVLCSELASNTAIAAVFAPLLIGLGPRYAASLGTSPAAAGAFLAVSGAVAASFGFALPVATPPNAIVYGTGRLDARHMLRAGVVLDAVLAVVVTALLVGLFVVVRSTVG